LLKTLNIPRKAGGPDFRNRWYRLLARERCISLYHTCHVTVIYFHVRQRPDHAVCVSCGCHMK